MEIRIARETSWRASKSYLLDYKQANQGSLYFLHSISWNKKYIRFAITTHFCDLAFFKKFHSLQPLLNDKSVDLAVLNVGAARLRQ